MYDTAGSLIYEPDKQFLFNRIKQDSKGVKNE